MLILAILILEAILLYLGQRRIFGQIYQRWGKLPAYLLAAPGTILHELAHLLMCIGLGVGTGRVRLFQPVAHEDGSITLGYVEHESPDPLRQALVAIAPLLLVPPLLIASLSLVLWANLLSDPAGAFQSANPLQLIVCAYLIISGGQGAFPSAGDHVGLLGAIALLLVAGLVGAAVPLQSLIELGGYAAIGLALPAGAAALTLAALRLPGWRQASRRRHLNDNDDDD